MPLFSKADRTRPLSEAEAARRGIKVDRDGFVRCRVCGCTEGEACNPPCSWVPSARPPIRTGKNIPVPMQDLCSACHTAALAILEWEDGAHRPSRKALLREVERMREGS